MLLGHREAVIIALYSRMVKWLGRIAVELVAEMRETIVCRVGVKGVVGV
jgi:hypothetical protein